MKTAPKDMPNEAFPLHGLGVVKDDRDPSRAGIRSALASMPHIVEALSPAPAPAMDATLDNAPAFDVPAPAPGPRM